MKLVKSDSKPVNSCSIFWGLPKVLHLKVSLKRSDWTWPVRTWFFTHFQDGLEMFGLNSAQHRSKSLRYMGSGRKYPNWVRLLSPLATWLVVLKKCWPMTPHSPTSFSVCNGASRCADLSLPVHWRIVDINCFFQVLNHSRIWCFFR